MTREFYLEATMMGDLVELMIINMTHPEGDKELAEAIKHELNNRWQTYNHYDFADHDHRHSVY